MPVVLSARTRRRLASGVAVSALVAAACGGGGSKESANTLAPAGSTLPVSTAAATTTTAAALATRSAADGALRLSEILPSLIQVEIATTFRPVLDGALVTVGNRGSGFIISEDGLAVTNNHVVTGAAFVEVYVGGSTDALSAKVLGVSECEDLAVIDIEGGGFTPTTWATAEPEPGTDIWAAGFPLGDPEPTLTKGIIAKAKADGDTNWASVDHVIEHDASIQPGNSGGPLFNDEGEVVAVNYAGGSPTNTEQFFSIAADLAAPVVDQLKEGDALSLGINGESFFSDELGVAGLWVAGVEDGSPASEAGVQAGDIVRSLRGLPIGTDGTMADYCKVLRSANDDDPISVEVLRLDTQESLEGEFNGRPLEVTFSFADEAVIQEDNGQQVIDEVGEAYTYTGVTDDSGRLSLEIPDSWEVDGAATAFEDGSTAPALAASPDLVAFNSDDAGLLPGTLMFVIDTPAGSITDEVLDEAVSSFASALTLCSPGDIESFDRGDVRGRFQPFFECGGEATSVFAVAATPPEGNYFLLLLFVAQTQADLEALDVALGSFNVLPA
jgi:serine protease Do